MQEPVRKKEKRSVPPFVWLILTAVLLGVCVFTIVKQNRESTLPTVLYRDMTEGNVLTRDVSEVAEITIIKDGTDPWTVIADGNGGLKMADDGETEVDPAIAEMLLESAAVVSYQEVLTEEASDYLGHEAEFGLETPALTAVFRYTDGSECTVHIGLESALDDETYSYMLVDGDERLFAADKGTVQVLMTGKELLHPVNQAGIQMTRIDRITVEDGNGRITAEWMLDGEITDADAANKWLVTVPFRYPADTDRISELIDATGNLYLGAFIAENPDENAKKEYGLDAPVAVLRLHMAAGSVGNITETGEYKVEDQPEEELTFIIGKERNDMVHYAQYQDCVYTMNTFQLDIFLKANVKETATRYPVNVAFEDLAELTVEIDGQKDVYQFEHRWETDENGESVHLGTCLKNDTEIDYAVFEAAYERLRVATVSGALEEGDWSTKEAYMKYTFRALNGGTHTTSFAKYDLYHDVVICDGYALWYMTRGSMTELP